MRITLPKVTPALSFFAIVASTFFCSPSHSFTLDWSGLYRIEALRIKNSELDNVERNKSYIHHHLILSPRAVVADGINVYSRFNIFNNSALTNSQFGQFFGNGISSAPNNSSENTNVLSENQADETLRVTQLYLTYDFEFMTFVAGRAPIQFGLGLTHNDGSGQFDHWYDNRDLLALELNMGNLKFRPIFAKVSEGALDIGDDVRDYMVQLDYENLETETAFGIMYQSRKSGVAGNDFPANVGTGGVVEGFAGKYINLYLKRSWDTFKFGFEGGFSDGQTGFNDSNGNKISQKGFGLALEMAYQAEASKWLWDLKAGFASGDDPSTTDEIEGFFFDRNYNIGMLLFNHVLGQFDALNSSLTRNTSLSVNGNTFNNAGSVPDVEVVSNAFFFAPGFQRTITDKWDWGARLVYAFLTEDTATVNGANTEIEKDLGFELDFNLRFRPHDRFTWITEAAFLLPGSAFEGGGAFESEFAYGVLTKAAINF